MLIKTISKIVSVLVVAVDIIALPALLIGDGDMLDTKEPVKYEEYHIGTSISDQIEAETIMLPLQLPEFGFQMESERVTRYAGINMTEAEQREMAGIIYLEAGNQSMELQQAIAEVILNRVISPDFPETVHDVLHEGEGSATPQFSPIGNLAKAEPAQTQYEAIDAALYGPTILPDDVVFFSLYGENSRVWGKIQNVIFCHAYIWE